MYRILLSFFPFETYQHLIIIHLFNDFFLIFPVVIFNTLNSINLFTLINPIDLFMFMIQFILMIKIYHFRLI